MYFYTYTCIFCTYTIYDPIFLFYTPGCFMGSFDMYFVEVHICHLDVHKNTYKIVCIREYMYLYNKTSFRRSV